MKTELIFKIDNFNCDIKNFLKETFNICLR